MQKTAQTQAEWDVIVVGGGPAGLMAAGTAAERGARVLLLEKNPIVGKKLLITGGGRCNVTNAETDVRKLLTKYRAAGKFLASPFSQWSTTQTLEFFHDRGMPTREEAEQRVFPLANSAQAVHDVLTEYARDTGVEVRTKVRVTGLLVEKGALRGVQAGSKRFMARSVIVATGGISHPETGSTGDGYEWMRSIGHSVREAGTALVPIASKDAWIRRAAGVSLRDVKISLIQNIVMRRERGKVLFTHVGLSGPGILNMSRDIGELLQYGQTYVELDLLPEQGYEKVNLALQDLLKEHHLKNVRNALATLIPPALAPALLEVADIDPELKCNSVTREMRVRLMRALKHLRVEVSHLLGADKAVVTAGGVDLREIDFRSMRSAKHPNLFVIGDMLDIDRPSGGYSLQLCWTTGFVAGAAAASMREGSR